jgi:autotransporter-associated beta strand protein
VADIALAAGGSGYLGEPLVTITPPPAGGVPATAVAEMIPDGNGTYRVASVTITCPGTGYTEVPGVSFSGGGNGAVAPTVGSVTLAANASGGLTKTGAGTLTLAAANTYTGVTTVAGGTLALGNAKALPTQTPVVLAGGTLDLNGYTVTNGLTAAGGSVVNGTLETVLSPGGAGTVGTNTVALSGAALTGTYLADVRADGACDRVIVEGDVNLGGLTLTLVDPGQLDISREYTLLSCTGTLSGALACGNLPAGRWRVVTRPDKTAVLLFTRGTLMRIH